MVWLILGSGWAAIVWARWNSFSVMVRGKRAHNVRQHQPCSFYASRNDFVFWPAGQFQPSLPGGPPPAHPWCRQPGLQGSKTRAREQAQAQVQGWSRGSRTEHGARRCPRSASRPPLPMGARPAALPDWLE